MWIYGVLIRFRKLNEPGISDLCHFGPTSIWGVYRKMLMVSVGNLSFVNGGGNFLTLPSGKANQIPRMKGLFAFQASFLTLSLISTSIFLSYLQSPNPFLFLTALHFDWHMVQSTFKKKVWVGQWRQKGKARALCFLFKGISGLKGPYYFVDARDLVGEFLFSSHDALCHLFCSSCQGHRKWSFPFFLFLPAVRLYLFSKSQSCWFYPAFLLLQSW